VRAAIMTKQLAFSINNLRTASRGAARPPFVGLAMGLLAACGAAAPAPAPDAGSGAVPTTIAGSYALHSEFDLAADLPGEAGKVVAALLDATDSPDDPTRYLVDLLVAELPDGSVKRFAQASAPYLAGYLNDRLLAVAPHFLTEIRDAGNKLGQIAHHFGTLEILDVAADGRATHSVTGLHFEIDRVAEDFAFRDFGQPDVRVDGVTATLDATGRFAISAHAVPLRYGQVLRLALDKAIIPSIDPEAVDLGDLLHRLVDCAAVGAAIADALELGSAATYQSACDAGLSAGARAVYIAMDSADTAALEFDLAGTAKALDLDRNGTQDKIQTGTWTGSVRYAGTPAPLAEASFYGERR
jgi:hypothetical protein